MQQLVVVCWLAAGVDTNLLVVITQSGCWHRRAASLAHCLLLDSVQLLVWHRGYSKIECRAGSRGRSAPAVPYQTLEEGLRHRIKLRLNAEVLGKCAWSGVNPDRQRPFWLRWMMKIESLMHDPERVEVAQQNQSPITPGRCFPLGDAEGATASCCWRDGDENRRQPSSSVPWPGHPGAARHALPGPSGLE